MNLNSSVNNHILISGVTLWANGISPRLMVAVDTVLGDTAGYKSKIIFTAFFDGKLMGNVTLYNYGDKYTYYVSHPKKDLGQQRQTDFVGDIGQVIDFVCTRIREICTPNMGSSCIDLRAMKEYVLSSTLMNILQPIKSEAVMSEANNKLEQMNLFLKGRQSALKLRTDQVTLLKQVEFKATHAQQLGATVTNKIAVTGANGEFSISIEATTDLGKALLAACIDVFEDECADIEQEIEAYELAIKLPKIKE